MKKSAILAMLKAKALTSKQPSRGNWLSPFFSPHPQLSSDYQAIISKLNSLERGKVYLVEGSKRLSNLPILLTHFYKNGVRFKPLCQYPPKIRRIWGNQLSSQPPAEPMTILYTRLPGFTFKEMDPSDIPLYLNRASPYMEDFFKKAGTTHA